MATITARCPKCGAQYQLTQEQLSIANGQVRCGACMTVFQAAPPQPAAPATPPPPPPPPKGPSKSAFVNEDDDLLLNDTGLRKSFDQTDDFATGEFSSDFADLDKEEGITSYSSHDEYDSAGDIDNTDESWAEALLSDEDEDDGIKPQKAEEDTGDDFNLDDIEDSLILQKSEEDELGLSEQDKEGLLGRITPEPLEFTIAHDYSLWKNLAYGFLALVLALSLGAQILIFQFDNLSREPQWRGVYEHICAQMGCTLPDQFNLQEISTKHLNVKSHPNYRDALMVDTIITNHAEIEQPFPKLQLFFTDNNQQVVAAREFKPAEYLRGELAYKTLMPSRQPIHLALAIQDPGPRATGYSVRLSY